MQAQKGSFLVARTLAIRVECSLLDTLTLGGVEEIVFTEFSHLREGELGNYI